MFLTSSQDFLAMNETRAMNVVANFIGLPKFIWSKYDEFVGTNTYSNHLHETVDDLKMPEAIKTRLIGFYAAFTHHFFDYTEKYGYWGCAKDGISDET